MGQIPSQEKYAIRNVFNKYGDTTIGRQKATQKLKDILRFFYGSGYEFRFYGTAVDSNGYITKYLVDQYASLSNSIVNNNTNDAMKTIESNGYLNIVFLKTENPKYEYPYGYVEYRIAPYETTDRHLLLPLGLQNLKFHGCKLNGTGINANSTETTDGGPVVKVTLVNQNQIVFSNNNITTARSNTSGLPVRQLTSKDFSAGTGRVSETVSQAPQA
jgi:hypothetical protein